MKKAMIFVLIVVFCALVAKYSFAVTPQISVICPNGGEIFKVGDVINIKWQSQGIPIDPTIGIGIWLMSENWSVHVTATTINADSYIWTIPANIRITDNAKIFIALYNTDGSVNGNLTDKSDNYFSIIPGRPTPSTPSCSDECVLSQRRSVGNGIQIGGNYDADPCLEWGPVIPCPNGHQSVDGKCVAVSPPLPPSLPTMKVGEWERIVTFGFPIKWFSILVDPKQWDIKDVKVHKSPPFNGAVDLASDWSVHYAGVGQDCNGFLVNMPSNHSKIYVSFFVKPKTNGFLKIHYVYGLGGKEKIEGDWAYEGVSDQMPGAPPKAQTTGKVGKQLTTWARIKAQD